jgi:hypothetical protein
MTINPCPQPRLSLLGALRQDPAPSSQHALDSLQNAGRELMSGRTDALPQSPQILEAAFAHEGLSRMDKELIGYFTSEHSNPGADVAYLLGRELKKVAEERVATDYVHNFDMHYAPGGGFRGSSSYNSPGETRLAQVTAFQREGAQSNDPALVQVDYVQPGHVGPELNGTIYDGKSSSRSTFFVPDLSKVVTIAGNTVADDNTCKNVMERLFNSLDAASPLQLHNYSTGYGRVGTSYHESIRVDGKDVNNRVLGAAATLHGAHQILQMPTNSMMTAPKPKEGAGAAIGAALLGAAAGGLGTLLAQTHPVLGLALGGATICGAGLLGKWAHKENRQDYPLPDMAALKERDQLRGQRGMQNGLLLGMAVTASAAAGAAFGMPGALGAGVACGVTEFLLAGASHR